MTKNPVTTTRKIGKITYLVVASSSDTAKDTLKKKIEKVIMKDLANIGLSTNLLVANCSN